MQDSFANPPQWLQLALTAVVSLIARESIVKLYNTWLNRKKPAAETTEITVRTYSQASDAMGRMMDRLDAAQVTIDGVREENNRLKFRVGQMELEAQSYMDQLQARDAFIKFLGHHPTEIDAFRVQLKEGKLKDSELGHPKQ